METKNILTSQKEVSKGWKDGFNNSGVETITYLGDISAETYCAFLELDYHTVKRLGSITYSIKYIKEKKGDGILYTLMCETYIDCEKNEHLSVLLEDSEDWLGFFTKAEVGKAQWLPSNWKELITDEQKEEVAKEWCKDNSAIDLLTDSEREEVAYDYMDENSCTCASHCYEKMGSYEQKDFLKECIDNL